MKSIASRFAEKLEPIPMTGCMLWIGSVSSPLPYGIFWRNGKNEYAHRVAYELSRGPVPIGKMVCHHCDVPSCCNPGHLFIGDAAANVRDMDSKGRRVVPPNFRKRWEARTHCKYGHEYTAENTIFRTQPRGKTPRRWCVICMSHRGNEIRKQWLAAAK